MKKLARRVNRTDAACVLVLLLITIGVYWPALFGGKVLLPADIVPLMPPWSATAREKFPELRFAQNQMHGPIFEYYSWRHYARERSRAGEIPLWNPYELGGNVLLANSQSAVLYPPNVLLYVFPLWYGINLVTVLHTFLTGLFAFGFLRSLKLGPPAAMTGALVWMFCGLQTVWTEFQTPTAVLCWLPAYLWAWQLFRQTGDRRWAIVGGGAAVALTLLAGHLHFAFYVLLAFALYGVWTAAADRRVVRYLTTLLVAIGIGVLLSACTMFPVVEMGRMNFRGAHDDYGSSIALRLPPENLFLLVIPNLFGNPRDYVGFDASGAPTDGHSYWGKFDYIEYTAYLGIPALVFAIIAILDFGLWSLDIRRRAPEGLSREIGDEGQAKVQAATNSPESKVRIPKSNAGYFILLAVIGLLLALGTPLCALFFYGVPGYRQFNATARALCLFSFAGAMLSAYGVQAILDVPENGRKRIHGSVSVSVIAVGVVGLITFPGLGLAWQRLFTDQWFGYELSNLRQFGLVVALTTALLWLLLRQNQITVGGSDRSKSDITTHNSRTITQFLVYLLPIVAAADLLVWGAGFNPMTDPAMLGYPTETTRWLRQAGPARVVSLETPGKGIKSFTAPNFNVVDHIREVQGADSLHTRRYHEFMGLVVRSMAPNTTIPFPDPNTIHFPSVDHPVFDMLNVEYITTQQPLDPARFERAIDAELPIWKNPRALGEAWCISEVESAESIENAVNRLSDRGFDLRKKALIDRQLDPLDRSDEPGTVSMTSFRAHQIEFDVAAPGRQLLLTSEIAFPGWRASIDGQKTDVITANKLLRAAAVPAGRHKVAFKYMPSSYRVGVFLTCLALLSISISIVYRIGSPKPE